MPLLCMDSIQKARESARVVLILGLLSRIVARGEEIRGGAALVLLSSPLGRPRGLGVAPLDESQTGDQQ